MTLQNLQKRGKYKFSHNDLDTFDGFHVSAPKIGHCSEIQR
jgi:hypothetical protein